MKNAAERLRLIEAILDGSASETDRAAFNAACRANPAFREAYIHQATIHSLALDDADAMRTVFAQRARWPRLCKFAAAALVAALLTGWVVAAVSRAKSVSAPAQSVVAPAVNVATNAVPAAIPAAEPVAQPVPAVAPVMPAAETAPAVTPVPQTIQQETTQGENEMKTNTAALVAVAAAGLSLAPVTAVIATESVPADVGTRLCSPIHAIETRSGDIVQSPEHKLDTNSPTGTIYRFL